MTKKMTLGLFLVASIPIIVMGIYSATIILNGCINANDFSMYHQAVINVWEQAHLNPFVPVRGTRMLNDHFEPSLWIASIWVGLTSSEAISLGAFELLIGLLTTSLPIFVGRNSAEKILGVFLLIFCRALLQGLEFPVHPTTWSAPLAWLLGVMIVRKNYREAALIALILPIFREIYPFMAIGFATWLFYIKQRRLALAITPVMLLWIAFSVWGRPALLGPTAKFHGSIATDILADPLGLLWLKLTNPGIQWNLFLQYIPLLGLFFWKKRSSINFKDPIFGIFAYIIPALGIHFLIGRMVHHHGIPMVLPLVGALTVIIPPILSEYRKYILVLCLLPLFLTSTSRYQRALKLPIRGGDFRCEINSQKRSDMKELIAFAHQLSGSKKMLASGDVIPILAPTKLALYQISPYTYPEQYYEYIGISKPGAGDPWPLNHEQQQSWLERCQSVGNIIFKNATYTILEGHFTLDCIQLDEIWNLGTNSELRVRQK